MWMLMLDAALELLDLISGVFVMVGDGPASGFLCNNIKKNTVTTL
jgi:hypothetical protein